MSPRAISGESVEALLETVRDLAAGETERGQSFNQRASYVLAFIGVILTLAIGQSRALLETDLGSVGKPASAVVLLMATVLLILAGRSAIAVITPRELWHISMEDVEKYPSREFASRSRVELQGRTMRGLIRQMRAERDSNNEKSRNIRRAVRRASWGVLALSGQLVIIMVRVLEA